MGQQGPLDGPLDEHLVGVAVEQVVQGQVHTAQLGLDVAQPHRTGRHGTAVDLDVVVAAA